MKWIKYQIVCGKNENEEDILMNKKVGYSNENLAIAQREAYDGYEIIDDEQSFEKEPLAIEFGGTGAKTAAEALKKIGAVPSDGFVDWFANAAAITSGSNLNNYTTPGKYACTSSSTSNTLLNSPVNSDNFVMFVFKRTSGASINQLIITLGSQLYIRGCNSSGELRDWVHYASKKSVDEAIATAAAPAGYGLGENIGKVAQSSNTGDYDANEIITSGWWRAKTNCPTNGWWSILHIAHSDDYATQYAFAYWDISAENSGTVVKRFKYKGAWELWEYVNPHMESGVEYRTTERFCGKPVYWKLVDIGALPNASSITVEHKIANIEYLVHKSLTAGYYNFPCHWGGNDIGDTEIYVNSNSILVKTTVDWSTYNGYAFLKYTKTTD